MKGYWVVLSAVLNVTASITMKAAAGGAPLVAFQSAIVERSRC